MARDFKQTDRDKAVHTAQGARVGTISGVDGDTATVTRDAPDESADGDDGGLTEELKSMLGWSDGDETHDLRSEHVERHEEDVVYLHGNR